MKVRYLLTAALALASTAAFAGDYKTCHFVAGTKSFCRDMFTGDAIARDQGSYKNCYFVAGTKNYCRDMFTGDAVILVHN